MSYSGFAPRSDRGEQPDHRRPSWSRRGVLLINLGTPDESDVPSVRRYLAEFLSDPEVIHLPTGMGWLNGALGRLIAYFRAPKSAKMYQRIWSDSGSPLGSITLDQVRQLETHLPDGWRVFPAMRYGRPSIAQTLREIEAAGVEELVVIPMYPQFSGPTTGTALRELYGSLHRGVHRLNVTTRNIWYDDGGYVYAQAKLIAEYAKQHQLTPDNTMLLFSAHGLPVSYVKHGDPYPAHVRRSIDLVAQRLGCPSERWMSACQSRFGPTKWLTPGTDCMLAELAERGEKRVLICPISFTADCLETLEELLVPGAFIMRAQLAEHVVQQAQRPSLLIDRLGSDARARLLDVVPLGVVHVQLQGHDRLATASLLGGLPVVLVGHVVFQSLE